MSAFGVAWCISKVTLRARKADSHGFLLPVSELRTVIWPVCSALVLMEQNVGRAGSRFLC
jgi:hypothetical protein